jgi:DNA ligase 1
MMLQRLAAVSAALAATRSRSEKTRLLAELLRELAADERATAVAWLAGVLPGGKLSLGPAAVYGANSAPALEPTLTVGAAAQALESLRGLAGKGSARKREEALASLFAAATAPEQRFLAGLLLGELRQGALEGVMIDAIAAAAAVPPAEVRRALMLAGRVAPVATAALEAGSAGLARFHLTMYEPLAPMLASPASDVDSALAALESAVLEYKLDGARVQIHKGTEGVRVFSRTGRDVTASVPEIAAAIAELPASAAILDGEVLALTNAGHPRPFQDTMRRFGRKLDVAQMRRALPLSLFCFDCLHVNGEDLIDRPLAERHERLASAVPSSRAYRGSRPPIALPRERSSRQRSRTGTKASWPRIPRAAMKRAVAAPPGSRSRLLIVSISSCSPPSGAMAGVRAGSAICTWVRAIRTAAS